jgi:asparagine synthase (glutamine-hydrolysing)
MCGLTGFVVDRKYFNDKDNLLFRLKRMNHSIKHRGPDDEGIEFFEYKNHYIGFAHRRLSIIDLSAKGHQPMSDENGLLWIIYNGEIYNFLEIKKDLIKKGYKFKSSSDTEVILYAYKEYGIKCLEFFNGIFSFVLWDKKRNEFFLVRDRIGVKPLMYSKQSWGLVFSSEIRSIISFGTEVDTDINYTGFNYYLSNGFIPSPYTIFKGIRKMKPSHYIIYKGNVLEDERRYWAVDYFSPENGSLEYFTEGLKEKLEKSVKRQMLSDVPVGALLSGGCDSGSIVGLMARQTNEQVKTFSIGFEDQTYNELNYARMVAERYNTNHHELIIFPDPVTFFNNMIDFIDEPFADTSSIPTFLVAQLAGKHVKVVLSGDGGDELFGGYDWYRADCYFRKLENLKINLTSLLKLSAVFKTAPKKKGFINSLKKIAQAAEFPGTMNTMRWHGFFTDNEKAQLLKKEVYNEMVKNPTDYSFYSTGNTNNKLLENMFFDLNFYLPDDILMKVDKMSMANSVESRVPLLDHELIEFTARIPGKLKNNLKGKSKIVFKEAVKKVLPEKIYKRKSKKGFSVPFKNWINNELKTMTEELLFSDSVVKDSFFNKRFLKKIYRDHIGGKTDNNHKIRSIIIFLMWKENLIRKVYQNNVWDE